MTRHRINSKHCFYVLKDCQEWKELAKKIHRETKRKTFFEPVSHRWVRVCITRKCLIDVAKVESYIYRPLTFKLPIRSFQRMVFEVVGLKLSEKLKIIDLYNALGSSKNAPDKSQVTHCLCGKGYKFE
jgi:hypothetical protein